MLSAIVVILSIFTVFVNAQFPRPIGQMREPSLFSTLFGEFPQRSQPFPPQPPQMQMFGGYPTDDYYDQLSMMIASSRFSSIGGFGSPNDLVMTSLLDKDNFQPQGCGWDLLRNRCIDGLNICKGGCRDFSIDVTHDCRCVPYGYMALLGVGKK